MRQALARHISDFKLIQESPIVKGGVILGYHASVISNCNTPRGSGTHPERSTAHAIAICEALERQLVLEASQSESRERLLLSEYPGSCGFAVGSTEESTNTRAMAEAVERWIRSKWIDDGYHIPEIKLTSENLSALAVSTAANFEAVLAFKTTSELKIPDGPDIRFYSCIVVGLKDGGAFVGSRTSVSDENLWDHALTEAWRHLHICRTKELPGELFEIKVIRHFGKNEESARSQISRAVKENLPQPRLRILENIPTGDPTVFCSRALCHDFKGWHLKEIDRFVY